MSSSITRLVKHPFVEYVELCKHYHSNTLLTQPNVTNAREHKSDYGSCIIFKYESCIITIFKVTCPPHIWLDKHYKGLVHFKINNESKGKVNVFAHEVFCSFKEQMENDVMELLLPHMIGNDVSDSSSGPLPLATRRSFGPHTYKRIGLFKISSKENFEVQECVPTLESERGISCIFIGHGLGGCCAIMGAYRASHKYAFPNIECYTFGAPKTGDERFASLLTTEVPKTYCLKHRLDIIPSLPLYQKFSQAAKVYIDMAKIPSREETHKKKWYFFKYLMAKGLRLGSLEFLALENSIDRYFEIICLFYTHQFKSQKSDLYLHNRQAVNSFIGRVSHTPRISTT